MNLFEKYDLSNEIVKTIGKMGISEPTQIQDDTIPAIIKGKDIIGESATGSGKTLAFGCGIVEHVIPRRGLQALILTPTRELAEQVKVVLKQLSGHKKLNILGIYGGVAINPQIRDLSRAEVVVATPGRLLDHLQRRTINLKEIRILVLDEADRMLDMGFIDDVEQIIQNCPKERQTLFFSATISARIEDLANRHMNKPIKVSATKMVDPKKLIQVYYDTPRPMKFSLLVHLLHDEKSGLVMVFCNTRQNSDMVADNLRRFGLKAVAIHGGLTQSKRNITMKDFHSEDVCPGHKVFQRNFHFPVSFMQLQIPEAATNNASAQIQ